MTTLDLLSLDRNLRRRGFVLGSAALGLAARGSEDLSTVLDRVERLRRPSDRVRARFAVKASR